MRISLLVFAGLFSLHVHAQNKINGYQYWFDNQNGNAVHTYISPVQNFTLSTQINTSSLLNGLHLFNIKFYDDSGRASITSSSFFYKLSQTVSSNIISYQYWFDSSFSNAVTQSVSSLQTFTLTNDISTVNLLNGLHVLHIRFKDNTNKWSETLPHFFYKADILGAINNVLAYQYWFDQNFAGAVKQSITPGTSYNLSSQIDATQLLDGLHVLHFRFLDNAQTWSSITSKFFYKSPETLSRNIVKYQFWFDQNFADAVQQSITPGTSYNLSSQIDVTQLLDGLHVLHVRFLDNAQTWSSTTSKFFYKSSTNSNNNIVKFQYWFDQNFASAVHQSITPTSAYNFSELIDGANLLKGLHTISLRFLDDENKWSSTISHFFYKEKVEAVAQNMITGYRYWFNEGDSSLSLKEIMPAMNSFILNEQIASDGLDSGKHVIHFQFRDILGKWSMVTSDTATVTAKAIYTFNGNGNWSNAKNWVNGIRPPLHVSGTYNIFIDPLPEGKCILDVNQYINTGAIITVRAGKTFIIPQNLNIVQ